MPLKAIDKIANLSYNDRVVNKETKKMDNMKIYRDGKYDIKANLAYKLSRKVPVILQRLDDGFQRLYEK